MALFLKAAPSLPASRRENEAAIENQAGESSATPENDTVQEPADSSEPAADIDQPDASDAEAEAVPLAVTSNEVQIEQPEAGAEFQVYLASAGSYENAKESETGYPADRLLWFRPIEVPPIRPVCGASNRWRRGAKIRPGFLRVHFPSMAKPITSS